MDYTTFRRGYPGDNFDRLKFHIEGAGKIQPVYILAMSIEDYSLERIKEKAEEIKGIEAICQTNGTINIIVKGNKKKVENIATQLHINSPAARVGIVKYRRQDMGSLYAELGSALNTAREKRKIFHVYDPNNDSVRAIIKKSLSGIE